MAYLHHMRAKKNEKHKNDNFFSDFKIAADYYSLVLLISLKKFNINKIIYYSLETFIKTIKI